MIGMGGPLSYLKKLQHKVKKELNQERMQEL